jgi:hypothetical protein
LLDWLPEDHLVWTILASVEDMDLCGFYADYRADGHGRPAYDPRMMVALLLYAYAKGNRSSRGIERACSEDVAYRVICSNHVPDHSTIAEFRVRHTPPAEPTGNINTSDHDSRIVRTQGQPAIQGYNAQAAVNEEQIIVAAELTVESPDFGHLEPMVVASVSELQNAGVSESPQTVVADPGYWHKQQMENVVCRGIQVVIPPDSGLRKGARPGWDKGLYAFMRRVLATEHGQAVYRRRLATIEPVFGQTKFNRRLDRFLRRGRAAWPLGMAPHRRHPQPPQAPQPPHHRRGELTRPQGPRRPLTTALGADPSAPFPDGLRAKQERGVASRASNADDSRVWRAQADPQSLRRFWRGPGEQDRRRARYRSGPRATGVRAACAQSDVSVSAIPSILSAKYFRASSTDRSG